MIDTALLNEYDKACEDYKEKWSILDQTLYDLCKRCPDHSSQTSVRAKLWIIGRTYATGIERKIVSAGTQGSSLEQLTSHFLAKSNALEDIFRALTKITEPLDPEKLKDIIAWHGGFVGMIEPILRDNQSPRAFASKYMHFHCPAVPLYDKFAVGALRKLYRWESDLQVFELPRWADEEYARHALRFWQFYQDMAKAGSHVNVKLLDNFLLWKAGRP